MVLNECETTVAECISILIDNGVVSDEVTEQLMEGMFHNNFEMYILLDWMLKRWVLLRKHKFHLPKRRTNKPLIHLTNLINSNST